MSALDTTAERPLVNQRAAVPDETYVAWRNFAEARLAFLKRKKLEHSAAIQEIDRELQGLAEVMGNGASGGTAWANAQRAPRRA